MINQEMRKQMSDRKDRCPHCRGTGTLWVLDQYEDAVPEWCYFCNGSGWVKHTEKE